MMLAVRNIEFGYAGSEKTLSGISLEARGAGLRAPASRARGRTLRVCEEIPPFRPR